ncbi:hypothetical protein RMCBS344292_07219 [Rhizopus microsporus]|nr:hypothetical protein RMCBS344292_07219 [Rhizopus microsporus]
MFPSSYFVRFLSAAYRGNNMSNYQSEQLFTREQVGQIVEEMSRKLNLDRPEKVPQTFQTKY